MERPSTGGCLRLDRRLTAAGHGLGLVGTGQRYDGEHRRQRYEEAEYGFTHCLLLIGIEMVNRSKWSLHTPAQPRPGCTAVRSRTSRRRVRVRKVCELEDREVTQAETGKGYEYARDQVVAITDEDLSDLRLGDSQGHRERLVIP